MAKSYRDRPRKPARPNRNLPPKPLILVVCEGKASEPEYINGFKAACRNPRVNVIIAKERGVPKTVVEAAKKHKKDADAAAKREKDDNLKYEAVWAVFDVDEHPHIPDAQQMARDNGIELAISNPAIELWLLLHFRNSPGMKDRKVLMELLKAHIEDYDKHVDFAKHYQIGYDKAVKRAEKLDQVATAAGTPGCNPSTGVYKLTESIRENS